MIHDESRYFDNNLQIKNYNFLEENDYNLFLEELNKYHSGDNYTCLFDKINKNEIKCKTKKKLIIIYFLIYMKQI